MKEATIGLGCVSADASSEEDSYKNASAFLSNWFKAALLVPSTATATAAREPQHLNSLVNSLNASLIMMHEQEQLQNHSPLGVGGGGVLQYVESVSVSSEGGSGAFPPLPFHRKPKEQQQSTAPSSCKKSKSHSDTKATVEDKHSTAKTTSTKAKDANTTSSAQPSTRRPLDRLSLSELDGPRSRRFVLGDKLRNPKHQIIESDPSKALSHITQLRVYDFAWILRSSREWTYAIVADLPDHTSIKFVIDTSGKTKTLKMKHWVKCIRLVDEKT